MIEILDVSSGQEYEAALHLKRKILTLWPDINQSNVDHIKIYVGLKLYGFRHEDIDLVIVGQLSTPRDFDIEMPFIHKDTGLYSPRWASVKNFILVVEEKSHPASRIKFTDKIAAVSYRDKKTEGYVWEDATEINRLQMFELKAYLEKKIEDSIYVQNLIFFTGLREADLPERPHNFFGSDAGFEKILNILGQISNPRKTDRGATIAFGAEDSFKKLLSPDFSLLQKLEPTALDRRRMDKIARDHLPEAWLEDVGNKQVFFKGHGGVGKTVTLLQMSYVAFTKRQLRSLLLTYNKALVADMRRTMALMGIPRSLEKGGISIGTVHAFIRKALERFDLLKEEDFLGNYEKNKNLLLEYIKKGTISRSDIDRLFQEHATEFSWDLIMVDEGQDWPENEIEILRAMYGFKSLVIADGIDQFVREGVADWSLGLSKDQIKSRYFSKCLRMKSNLAVFASEMAHDLGLADWDLAPNLEANGGRVMIFEGALEEHPEIYEDLKRQAVALGNHPVDLLACVPPNLVEKTPEGTISIPGKYISDGGGKVWDASDSDVRENYPTDRDELRLVQYDSCRGLEGWTTINYGFDDFWEYKYSQALKLNIDADSFYTPEDAARIFAARWMMIPLTRAMDTLVIGVSKNPSFIKQKLERICDKRGDFIEWITL